MIDEKNTPNSPGLFRREQAMNNRMPRTNCIAVCPRHIVFQYSISRLKRHTEMIRSRKDLHMP